MKIDFQDAQLFNERFDPRGHTKNFLEKWRVVEVPSHLWFQVFFYWLGPIPKAWYIHEDIGRQTSYCKNLQDQFAKIYPLQVGTLSSTKSFKESGK
jgi:hypothetical protein